MSIVANIGNGGNPTTDDEYAFDDEIFSSQYPALYEFLSRIRVEGKSRQPSALLVTVEPRRVQLCLMDRHTAQVTFHAARGLSEGLEGLDGRLSENECDWRVDKKQAWRNSKS